MITPDPLSPIVEKKLRQVFPEESERETARKLLVTYGAESWQREHNRVCLAILKTCNGKIDSLKGALTGAKQDYRDALAAAEFPEQFQTLTPSTPEIIARDRNQYLDWLNTPRKS